MLTFLPAPLIGIIAGFLYLFITVVLASSVLIIFPFSYLLPIRSWRKACTYYCHNYVFTLWKLFINWTMWLTSKTYWDIQGSGELSLNKWYLLICNHQSWLDIIILEKVFQTKIPPLKFFMKKELLWTLPVAGIACWVVGFPFMKRYSQEYLKKHPEKAGKDLAITKKACEKFNLEPATMMNFIEGTRFTKAKQQKQNSPYKYLLRPKAGGFAFVIAALAPKLDFIVNVTLIYPDSNRPLWDFLCNRFKKITVRYEILPVTQDLRGDYFHDAQFRQQLQVRVNELWQGKDNLIAQIKNEK